MTTATPTVNQRIRRPREAFILLALAITLCLLAAACYLTRADGMAAITVFPVWTWALPGLLLTGLGWRAGWRCVTVVILLWLLYLGIISDEAHSLASFHRWPSPGWPAAPAGYHAVRVVSLNCGGGSPNAAREVIPFRPDIVLLQETPQREAVEEVARRLFGEEAAVVAGPDAVIIARGRLEMFSSPETAQAYVGGAYVQARLIMPTGLTLEVVSLRLLPPLVRTDLWSANCWRAQRDNRRDRRRQLAAVMARVRGNASGAPMIIGGDFNAPAGDAIFRELRPLRDTFRRAGVGWGNSHSSDFPILRIDQVWASAEIRPVAVTARKTRHSDHRMVIGDLLVPMKVK
jgi:endonuclease/exonuclease/phosphatase (EEP) superfamily protein YafD